MLCFYIVAYEPILRHWSFCKPTENNFSSHFLMFSVGIEKKMWHEVGLRTLKSSRSQIFFRIGALKNFAIFKEKHLSWSLFLIKLKASSPAALFRYFPLNIAKFLRTVFFIEQYQCLVLDRLTFTIKLFFAQIINYLSFYYICEGSEYAPFFTAYVRKKWVFN